MSTPTTHLLIDGSNVLHAWPDTRALARRDQQAAKALLVRTVGVLHDLCGWRITVVFDGRGDALQVESVGDAADFACVHSPAGATADDIIEQLVGRATEPARCLVVTADRAERTTVEAAGAVSCDPAELLSRIHAASTQQTRTVARNNEEAEQAWRHGGKP